MATDDAWAAIREAQPPAGGPALAAGSTEAFVAGLVHFRDIARECPEAHALVAECAAGSPRRVALHLFFETADTALREMEREEHEVRSGRATLSPHQPDRAKVVQIVRSHCALLVAMRHARKLVVRPADSGFFCPFLAVLDALLLAPPHLEVDIDWRLHGGEQHFTYRPPRGECVWRCLFAPVSRPGDGSLPPGAPTQADAGAIELQMPRFNFFLTARFRGFAASSANSALMRRAYHAVFARFVRPRHPTLVDALGSLGAELRGSVSLGIHKRVETPGTAEYQGCRRVFSSADFIAAAHRLIATAARPVACVFLATDDAHAEAAFRAAFGARLRIRSGVQRVPGGLNADGTLNEVHISSPHNPGCSVRDAADVLADAMLLACCGCVLHMDSNVTSAVALMNPEVAMVHITDAVRRG